MVPPGSHALDPEVRLVVVVRPGPRGFEGGVGSQPGSASEPFRLGAGDRRSLSPDAHDRQVAVRAGPGDPTGPDHAGVSPRGAEGGAADGITLPSASVRPGTQSLVRGGGVGYLHVSGDGGSTRGDAICRPKGWAGGGEVGSGAYLARRRARHARLSTGSIHERHGGGSGTIDVCCERDLWSARPTRRHHPSFWKHKDKSFYAVVSE